MDLGDVEPSWCGVYLNRDRIWLPEGLSYSRPELGAAGMPGLIGISRRWKRV